MRFVDCVTIRVIAGHGGRGCVAYRKEKFVAKGGPYGGNGGKGGDVLLVADRNIGTLLDLRYRRIITAQDGRHGMTKRQHGAQGIDEILRVPVGTLVRDAATRHIIADLQNDGDTFVAARGGRGGQGNAAFKNAVRQTPHFAQPGEDGTQQDIVLELKLLADIGIIGYPSVGKSTLISVVSNARPKIAAYHFTTLVPNLGIVRTNDYRTFIVADIPGLVDGAHQGRGLGARFLRHIERCRALVHLIEVQPDGADDPSREPLRDFDAIMNELRAFSEPLANRPQIVVLTKMDLPWTVAAEPELRAHFEAQGLKFVAISSASREGIAELVEAMRRLVDTTEVPDAALFTAPDDEELTALPEEEVPLDWDGTTEAPDDYVDPDAYEGDDEEDEEDDGDDAAEGDEEE
jgi:GTP-binding protein